MTAKDNLISPKKTLNLSGKILDLTTPRVMGILNATPDSFYAGSRQSTEKAILSKAGEMIEEGADILDLGGYSTRPGAPSVGEEEEWDRIAPMLGALTGHFPEVPVSVDTFRASIARKAVLEGAAMINDISGGSLDEAMFDTVASLKVPYVLMHMRGTPADMQKQTDYSDLITDIFDSLQKRHQMLTQLGVADVILDTGFGFAKTRLQNFRLLRHLDRFVHMEAPLLVGLSRKSLVWKTLEGTPEQALNGTTALHALALDRGADILRVHDVREAVEVIALVQNVRS